MLDAVDGRMYNFNNFVNDEIIKVPIENVLFYATMNLGSKYVGVNALDEALLDRFNVVNFKGYDEKVEKEIMDKGFKTQAKEVSSLVNYIRTLFKDGAIRSPISTRGIKIWAEAFLNSDGTSESLIDTFNNTLLYRIVSVDDVGNPNEEEVTIVKKKLETLFKPTATPTPTKK